MATCDPRADGEELARNRRPSTGVVLNAIGAVAVAALMVLGLTTTVLAPSVSPSELRVGDCVAHFGSASNGETAQIATVKKLNCDKAQYGEVYYQGTLAGALPSESELVTEVEDVCVEQVPDTPPNDSLYIEYFFPTTEAWLDGDRVYVCFITSDSPPLVGQLTDG